MPGISSARRYRHVTTTLTLTTSYAAVQNLYPTRLQFYNTNGECTLLFSSHGLYRLLHEPYPVGEKECCLDMPSLVSLPPSWAANMSFAGQQMEPFSQTKVRGQYSLPPRSHSDLPPFTRQYYRPMCGSFRHAHPTAIATSKYSKASTQASLYSLLFPQRRVAKIGTSM